MIHSPDDLVYQIDLNVNLPKMSFKSGLSFFNVSFTHETSFELTMNDIIIMLFSQASRCWQIFLKTNIFDVNLQRKAWLLFTLFHNHFCYVKWNQRNSIDELFCKKKYTSMYHRKFAVTTIQGCEAMLSLNLCKNLAAKLKEVKAWLRVGTLYYCWLDLVKSLIFISS